MHIAWIDVSNIYTRLVAIISATAKIKGNSFPGPIWPTKSSTEVLLPFLVNLAYIFTWKLQIFQKKKKRTALCISLTSFRTYKIAWWQPIVRDQMKSFHLYDLNNDNSTMQQQQLCSMYWFDKLQNISNCFETIRSAITWNPSHLYVLDNDNSTMQQQPPCSMYWFDKLQDV